VDLVLLFEDCELIRFVFLPVIQKSRGMCGEDSKFHRGMNMYFEHVKYVTEEGI